MTDRIPRWPLSGGDGLRTELLAAWGDPSRGYHDLDHLRAVLARLAEMAAAGTPFDDQPVQLAAWFHDAVYDGDPGAEDRSAAWAEEALPGLVDDGCAIEVARLVRLTEHHCPAEDDRNGCALVDADLAILAAPESAYDAYVAAVRREYAHVPEDAFRAGRAEVLRSLAAKPHLFHTAHGRAHWETAARANLERELSDLALAAPPA